MIFILFEYYRELNTYSFQPICLWMFSYAVLYRFGYGLIRLEPITKIIVFNQ